MDLKVAGTADGVTGMQMDVKVDGLTLEIIEKTHDSNRPSKARIGNLESHEERSSGASRCETLAVRSEDPPIQDRPGRKHRLGHRSSAARRSTA